jgi:hypothetical protein
LAKRREHSSILRDKPSTVIGLLRKVFDTVKVRLRIPNNGEVRVWMRESPLPELRDNEFVRSERPPVFLSLEVFLLLSCFRFEGGDSCIAKFFPRR